MTILLVSKLVYECNWAVNLVLMAICFFLIERFEEQVFIRLRATTRYMELSINL